MKLRFWSRLHVRCFCWPIIAVSACFCTRCCHSGGVCLQARAGATKSNSCAITSGGIECSFISTSFQAAAARLHPRAALITGPERRTVLKLGACCLCAIGGQNVTTAATVHLSGGHPHGHRRNPKLRITQVKADFHQDRIPTVKAVLLQNDMATLQSARLQRCDTQLQDFLAVTLSGVSAETLNAKPVSGKWSAHEQLAHLA